MFNITKVTGSAAKRLTQSSNILEDVFEVLGHSAKRIKTEKFQTILDHKLPFPTKVTPLDDPSVAGYMQPLVKDGKFLGAKLALPHDEFLGTLKLEGDDIDTVFHELAHATHYKVDPRIAANERNIKNIVLKKFETAPDVDYIGINNKINELYKTSFYEWKNSLPKVNDFTDKVVAGGKIKDRAIKERLKYIADETDKITKEIPDNELKIAFLKRMRDGLRTEDYAWGQGKKFRAQAEINKDVQSLIEKDGKVDELLDLKETDQKSYIKKVNEYFEKANLNKKQDTLNSDVEWNNNIGYMFGEKINYLNDKIANLIRIERRKMAFNRAFEKSSNEKLMLPKPSLAKPRTICTEA